MKRTYIIASVLVCTLLLSAGMAAAQGSPTKAVSVNPLGLVFEIISAEYEMAILPGTTMGFQGLYWNPDLGDDLDLTAFGGAVGVRKYVTGRAFDGVYLGAYGGFASVSGDARNSATDEWESASATVVGISGVAGIKWLAGNGFVADLGVSVGFPLSTTISSGDISESDVSGVMDTTVYLSVGYAW